MNFTKPFSQISKADASTAGGKGASLGEMSRAGIPVPPGFVVLSTTFDKFLEDTDLLQEIEAILSKVDHKAIHTVDAASEQIKELIESQEFPKAIADEVTKEFKKLGAQFVAVRSSATAEDGADHAWAGQLESYLNTTEESFLTNVKKCWASLFTPRAIFYRFEKGLHTTHISVAVVVQKMVQSEKSGIAFSVHPVTEDYNQLIIEAGFGLGEAIVSGSVTPDSYVVEKSPRNILDINVNEQTRALYKAPNGGNEWKELDKLIASSQVLTKDEILELSELILKIEKHYGFPCDIEWAYEARQFYITQSRPITTLQRDSSVKAESTILSKIFSREKSLFYFSMWNDSDRRGWKNFLGHDVKQNLFLVPPPGNKGSVWYAQSEVAEVDALLKRKLEEDPKLLARLTETLDSNWKKLIPYLTGKKKIGDVREFDSYYKTLVEWWSAMTTAFNLPDLQGVDKQAQKTVLKYRTESEKYTEQMSKIMGVFWNEHFPDLSEFAFCVVPGEVSELEGTHKEEVLSYIQQRKNGCILFNGVVYPIQELNKLFAKNNLTLENLETENTQEIKGTPAFRGKVSGRVKKVSSFADMKHFAKGEILVTEMTNPDYVPIMKLATAIVTDEGGTTCHAAIASRELKVPCIVGTKIATQVLKDGDVVEVDADSGVVRVLKQTKQSFVKAYTRDFSIIMQEAWFYGNKEGLIERLDLSEYPFDPPYIYFMQDGVEEVWENTKGNEWLYERLSERLKKDTEFFPALHKRYLKALARMEQWWKTEITTLKELEAFLKDLFPATADFVLIYGATLSESLPPDQQKLGNEFREKDKFFAECNTALEKALKTIYPKLGSLALYITREELAEKPSVEELERRDKGFVLIPGIFSQAMPFDSFVQKFSEYDFKVESFDPNAKTLNGQTAYQGKVSGKVRIIKRKDQIQQVQEGEIIVSPMTTPEMVSGMKKAAAFVTDEGGITCHAAIIAREMKKPCIIGTKVATQVLKDGDLIEVDADNGTIRLLSNQQIFHAPALKSFTPDDWHYYGLWRQDLFSACFWNSWFDPKIFKSLGLDLKEGGTLVLAGGNFFYKKPVVEEVRRQVLKMMDKHDLSFFKKNADQAKKSYLQGVKLSKALPSEGKISRETLEEFLEHVRDMSLYWCFAAVHLAVVVEKVLQDKVVQHSIPAEYVPHLVPKIKTPLFAQQIELRELKKEVASKTFEEVKKDKTLLKKLEAHRSEYAWIEIANWIGDELTLERLYNQIEHAAHEVAVPELKDIPKDLAYVAECLGYVGYVKQAGAEYVATVAHLAHPFLKAVAKQIGVTYREMMKLSHYEVLDALDGKYTAADLKKRVTNREQMKWLVLFGPENELVFIDDPKDIARLEDVMIPRADKSVTEIKGEVGNRGKANGVVRIVMNVDDFQKLKPGEILVTTMTTPDFVILMQKAGAIITDIGGMLCHAAIVSREIGKPCVIGTKFATQILNDGDMVEVNADEGIVKVLEKKHEI